MQGKLFTQDFLAKGITETHEWKELKDQEIADFRSSIENILALFSADSTPNESVTEAEVVMPVLQCLGWESALPQQGMSKKGRTDIPDILLFESNEQKQIALKERSDDRRYKHALAIVESKRWLRPLDRGEQTDLLDQGTPSNQILRYLSRVDVASDGTIEWGMLTNGRYWRLYYQRARSRSEEFLEIDIVALAGGKGFSQDIFSAESQNLEHFLKVFYLLFRRRAFLVGNDTETFHARALRDSRLWEERVSKDLGDLVFERLFPQLVSALVEQDPEAPAVYTTEYLELVRRDAMTLLYRLLFVMFAEDRNLLPVRDSRYDDYSARRIRLDIARRMDADDIFSESARRYANHLKDLFIAIGKGDASIGLPPYNGGLFDDRGHPVLDRTLLPDSMLAPLIDSISRRQRNSAPQWINYRDLSVQHLGSVYERLLEYTVVTDNNNAISVKPNIYARKGSGSYYTHEDLVQLIIEETVEPLVKEITNRFDQTRQELGKKRSNNSTRLDQLKKLDPAARILDLKICDPAMGSGHFLVSLVDYIADKTLELIESAPANITWDKDKKYRSPLERRLRDIREQILASAKQHKWTVDAEQLDDRHIVRRMILKRVVYGVDKNPMAVELAKVSLWLHTFTVGAPLSFLDHHLVVGDALFGEHIADVLTDLREFGALFQQNVFTRIGVAADSMARLSEITDVDIAEVQQSRSLFDDIHSELRPVKRLLDFWQALRWIAPIKSKGKWKKELVPGLPELLDGKFGDTMTVVANRSVVAQYPEDFAAAESLHSLLEQAVALAERENFLHWEITFPLVWRGLAEGRPSGGFDVIIGNPPWDRIKLQEVEWFASRLPEIAAATRASDRKKKIKQLEQQDAPLWRDFLTAKSQSENAARVARESGDYPLLSKGDVNIYSLFVERASGLVHANGIVGLLTPSGIASDKGASEFFKSIATTGRLKSLFDFENKKTFFPDVDSRFKFCCLVFGATGRSFAAARCAFFLHGVDQIAHDDRAFVLSAVDFERVNPNTGTAPIFRRNRDAEITTAIYNNFPVLVDRRSDPPKQVWPVKYHTMFHMTNDSHLFKRKDELETEGFYPVGGNRWRKSEQEYVPLYVGRMIHQYDHRASSVLSNEENVHNPALSDAISSEDKSNTSFCTTPQYWIPLNSIDQNYSSWALGFRDIARSTDARTFIATLVPTAAAGNTLPLIVGTNPIQTSYQNFVCLFLANINSMVTDYVTRQKVQSTHLNWYIVEQLPLIPPNEFQKPIGTQTIAEFVCGEVLRLVFTANDMTEFAKDMGYEGKPFAWDEEDRRHRKARLDALFFHLYGINREDADYILEQFPIVKEQDNKAFGSYRRKDLVLAYMNAIAAGDTETVIDL